MKTRIYVAPLDDVGNISVDGAGEINNWVEITKDVHQRSVRAVRKKIDKNEFEIGFVSVSRLSFKVLNLQGLYSDVGETNSTLFKFTRSDTPVRITFDPADDEPQYDISRYSQSQYASEVEVFRGLLDDSSTKMSLKDHSLNFQIIGFENLLKRTLIPVLSVGDTVETTLFKCLDQASITKFVNVSASNINVSFNPTLDVVSHFDDETIEKVFEELLLVSNAFLFIDSNRNVIVKNRIVAATSSETFFGPASDVGVQNIINVEKIDTGTTKVINFVKVKDTTTTSEDATSIGRHGIRRKEIDIPSITIAGNRQIVADNLVTFFANPKRRFTLKVEVNVDRIAYDLMSKFVIDFPPLQVESDNTGIYEVSDYDLADYVEELSSFEVNPLDTYALIATKLNLNPLKYGIDFEVWKDN